MKARSFSESRGIKGSLSFRPGSGLNVALHASLTARNSAFLLSAFPCQSASFSLVFFPT